MSLKKFLLTCCLSLAICSLPMGGVFAKDSFSHRYLFEGTSNENSNAECSSQITYTAVSGNHGSNTLKVSGGHTVGKWSDGWTKCDGVVLNQKYTVNKLDGSISWPASVGFSHSSKTGTWSSEKVNGSYATAPHDTVSVTGINENWLKISVKDEADFYIGSRIYKANSSISKTYNQVAY